MTKTEIEVDAVLSADVGDAPMRQRQYTAPVHAPSAYGPHAVRRTTTRNKSLAFSGFRKCRNVAGKPPDTFTVTVVRAGA
jgi:hypothetical protein